MTYLELTEKRAKAIADARAILKKAEEENRNLTAEEKVNYDKAFDDQGELQDRITRAERDMKLETEQREMENTSTRTATLERSDRGTEQNNETKPQTRTIELRKSISGLSRNVVVPCDDRAIQYAESFCRFLIGGPTVLNAEEVRALQKDSDSGGGYLSAPMQFQATLIKEIDDIVFMRQICNVLPAITTADSLGSPSLDNDPDDSDWTSELATGDEDDTMSLGKRELKPHPLAKRIKVSKTLLRRSAIGVDDLVRSRLAYKNGITQEQAFLNGSGAAQPLGVFTASDNGISTSRDVSTDNTTTEMTFDGLKEVEYSLKQQYRKNCKWIFHRDGVKQLSKIKDGEGRYIWQQSVVLGDPDTILKFPVMESEYAPNTFTTGLYVGILGDFNQYWIVDALTLTIQVLLELYATTNQNGYLSRMETDGMPIKQNAFARVKLA